MNTNIFTKGERLTVILFFSFILALILPGATWAQTTTADTTVGSTAGANNTLNIGGAGPQSSKATAIGFGPLATAPALPQATPCVTSESDAKGYLFGAYSNGGSTQKVRDFCEYQDQYMALIKSCKFGSAARLQKAFMSKSGIEMEISPDDKDLSMKECLKPQEPKVEVPAKQVQVPSVQKVSLSGDALFDFDKYDLKPEGLGTLDKLAVSLQGVDIASIVVVGHTDSMGSDDYNIKLSYKRAEAVRGYLIGRGVDANKLVSFGKGEREPIASNSTEEGRAKNRRVEIQIVGIK